MRYPRRLILGVGLVVLAGCSMQITADYDRSKDFSKLETYSWAPADQPATVDPLLTNSLLDSRVRRAVNSEFAAKGYRELASGDPDFLVQYHVTRQTRYAPTFAEPGWASGLPTEADQYEQGTLVLDVLDPSRMRLLWRGTASTAIDESAGPQEREATINKAVYLILKRFPPPPR